MASEKENITVITAKPTIVAVLKCPICKREVDRPLPLVLHDGLRCADCEDAGYYCVHLQLIGFREVP